MQSEQWKKLSLPAQFLSAGDKDFRRCPTGLTRQELVKLEGRLVPADALERFNTWVFAHVPDDESVPWYRYLARRATGASSALVRSLRVQNVGDLIAVLWYDGWLRPRGPGAVDGKVSKPEELQVWLRTQAEAWEVGHNIAKEEKAAVMGTAETSASPKTASSMRRRPSTARAARPAPPDSGRPPLARRDSVAVQPPRAKRLLSQWLAMNDIDPSSWQAPVKPQHGSGLIPRGASGRRGRVPRRTSGGSKRGWPDDNSPVRQLDAIGARAKRTQERERQRYQTIKEEMQEQLRFMHSGVRRSRAEVQTDLGVPTTSWITTDLLRGFVCRLAKHPDLFFSDEMISLARIGRGQRARIGMRIVVHCLQAALWMLDKQLKRAGRPALYTKHPQKKVMLNLRAQVEMLEEKLVQLNRTYCARSAKMARAHDDEIKSMDIRHKGAIFALNREMDNAVAEERKLRERAELAGREALRLADVRAKMLEQRAILAEQHVSELRELLSAEQQALKHQKLIHQVHDANEKERQVETLDRMAAATAATGAIMLQQQHRHAVAEAESSKLRERLEVTYADREKVLLDRIAELQRTVAEVAADKQKLLGLSLCVGRAEGKTLAELACRNAELLVRARQRPREPTLDADWSKPIGGTWDRAGGDDPVWWPERSLQQEHDAEEAANMQALGMSTQWKAYGNGGLPGAPASLGKPGAGVGTVVPRRRTSAARPPPLRPPA